MATNNYDAIIVGGGHNGLVAAAYYARAGARTLVLEARRRTGGAIPSTLDPTLTPEGVHYFSLFTQYVPHEWSQAPHREELEAYADRVIDLYTELAPNFKRSVIDRQVLGPTTSSRISA